MQYKVMINQFEGPLDLLLHLIKEDNIDIYDIEINKITEQYLDYIRAMKNLNLSIASEYLVMASELIEIKSKMLLPKDHTLDDDEFEEDPKEALIQRLVSYKQYKEITSDLKELELTRKLFFTKSPEDLSCFVKDDYHKENLGIDDLVNAFNDLLKNKLLSKPLSTKVTKKELSVTEKINKIKDILTRKKKVGFEEIFDARTKEEIIISFLSILQMAKDNQIIISQDKNFNNIVISLREGDFL